MTTTMQCTITRNRILKKIHREEEKVEINDKLINNFTVYS